jgi:PAN domain
LDSQFLTQSRTSITTVKTTTYITAPNPTITKDVTSTTIQTATSTSLITTFVLKARNDDISALEAYPENRISSACSCLIGSAPTVTRTKTVSAKITSKTLSTQSIDISITKKPTSTIIDTSTVEVTSTTTSVIGLWCDTYGDPDLSIITGPSIGGPPVFDITDAQCRDLCEATPNCESYTWVFTTGSCMMFTFQLTTENTELDPASQIMNNKACPNFASDPVEASTSSTSSSSTSTASPSPSASLVPACNKLTYSGNLTQPPLTVADNGECYDNYLTYYGQRWGTFDSGLLLVAYPYVNISACYPLCDANTNCVALDFVHYGANFSLSGDGTCYLFNQAGVDTGLIPDSTRIAAQKLC